MILLIEDNIRLCQNITEFLRLEKFQVEAVREGKTGLQKALSGEYALLILDRHLPLVNGLHICQELRASGSTIPILMLTSQGQTEDRIEGLNAGADDYLPKPFDFEELLARIRALLRRESVHKAEKISFGEIEIDFAQHEVYREKKKIELTPKEFALLEFFTRHKGYIKNRTQILDGVWGSGEEEKLFFSDTVAVHISCLRKKLGKDIIRTVRGVGYIFETT